MSDCPNCHEARLSIRHLGIQIAFCSTCQSCWRLDHEALLNQRRQRRDRLQQRGVQMIGGLRRLAESLDGLATPPARLPLANTPAGHPSPSEDHDLVWA